MDASQMAYGDQMGSGQPSNDINSMPLDFDALMGSGQQFSHGFDAIGHFNHDDSCLDPQGLIHCAHASKVQSALNANGFRAFQQNASIMATLRNNHIQTHSRDRHSISNTPQALSIPDQVPAFSWDSLFNDNLLDTSHFFPASHELQNRPMNTKTKNKNKTKRECDDDDCATIMSCSSDCGASCPSQCGETSQGVCCDDDTCADPELCIDETCRDDYQPCTDAHCTSLTILDHPPLDPGISDGDKQAAAALASFGGNQIPFIQNSFSQFHSNSHLQSPITATSASHDGELTYMGLSETPCSNFSFNGAFEMTHTHNSTCQFWPTNTENLIATHILQYHDPRDMAAHVRPCIADNLGFSVSKCTLPKPTGDDALTHNLDNLTCDFPVDNVDQLAQHLFLEHKGLEISEAELLNLFRPPQPTNMANNVSMLRPGLATPAYSLNAASSDGRRLSPSDSSLPNLSVGPSLPPSPPSLETSPLLQPERFSTETLSTTIATQTPPTSPGPHVQAGKEEEFICRWRTGCGAAICGKKFNDADELHTHGKAEHLKKMVRDDAGFHCSWDDCSRTSSFNQKSKLDRHLQTHTGYKPVKCNICGMQLSAKQSLDQHMRTHTGEKPWKCKFPGCSHAFKQQSALTMHERTHTGYKPLVCDICGKSFGESSNLSKHRRTHNTRGNHVCSICNKDFHRLDQLRRHMHTNHKYKPEEVDMILKQVRGPSGKVSRVRAASALATSRNRNENLMEPINGELEDLISG